MTIKEKEERNKELRNYLISLGYKKISDKVYQHPLFTFIEVMICFFPCSYGVMIWKQSFPVKKIFSHPDCTLEELKEQLAKLMKVKA